jgi:hypothetical protein
MSTVLRLIFRALQIKAKAGVPLVAHGGDSRGGIAPTASHLILLTFFALFDPLSASVLDG